MRLNAIIFVWPTSSKSDVKVLNFRCVNYVPNSRWVSRYARNAFDTPEQPYQLVKYP